MLWTLLDCRKFDVIVTVNITTMEDTGTGLMEYGLSGIWKV